MLRDDGQKVGFFKPITLWPFPDRELKEIAEQVDVIVVPELNLGQMVLEVERAIQGKARIVPINKVDGEPIKPQAIAQIVKES